VSGDGGRSHLPVPAVLRACRRRSRGHRLAGVTRFTTSADGVLQRRPGSAQPRVEAGMAGDLLGRHPGQSGRLPRRVTGSDLGGGQVARLGVLDPRCPPAVRLPRARLLACCGCSPGRLPHGGLADRLINTFTKRGRLRYLPGQAARIVRPNGPGVRALGQALCLGQSRDESEEPRASAWPWPASGRRPAGKPKRAGSKSGWVRLVMKPGPVPPRLARRHTVRPHPFPPTY
jgi:hypothetical protein